MKTIRVEVSSRHLHITHEDLEKLFGGSYELTPERDLSQKGEFASQAIVSLVGPKGKIDQVRIVGPCRNITQVEVSRTDCFNLGIKAPLRLSGKIEGSGKVKIIGPVGEIDLEKGVIVAKRHLHLSEEDAHFYSVKNGQNVAVKIDSPRALIFEQVEVRIKEGFSASLHLDTDEANAAWVDADTEAQIIN